MSAFITVLFMVVLLIASCIAFAYTLNLVNHVCWNAENRKDPTYVVYAIGLLLTAVGLCGVIFNLISSAFAYDIIAYIALGSGVVLIISGANHLLAELPIVHRQITRRMHT